MALYEIKDINPNPFRQIDRYPIQRAKVDALRESIRKTGFWGNVVARVRDGKAEIVYGHHRLVALQEECGPNHKVELIIRDLDDEAMIQMMARQNMEEWNTSAIVSMETIRAVVEAYGAGLISLPGVPKKTSPDRIRYAPSFARTGADLPASTDHPYTANTLANFLGWVDPARNKAQRVQFIRSALTALQLVDEGILVTSDYEGLTSRQAHAVTRVTRKTLT